MTCRFNGANNINECQATKDAIVNPEIIASLVGWIGGIVGGTIGILAGVIGTYFTISNTNGPRERAFVARAGVVFWLLIVIFLAGLLLIPTWHRHLLWAPYAIALIWGIRIANKKQFQIRREESAKAT